MATPGKVGRVLTKTLYPVISFTDEAMTANGLYNIYTITDSTKSYWYEKTAATIKKNGSAITSGFTINYGTGVVTFASALLETDVITASGDYYLTSDTSIAFTDEATTASADYKRYTISDSGKVYWDKNATPIVEVDGVVVTSGYSIEYPGGVIVFDAAQESSAVATVSGKYITVEQLIGFFNWSLTVNNTTIDATSFTSGEWSEFVLATKNWEATAEKFWASTDDFSQRMGEDVIVVLYCDFGTAKTRFEGYAVIQSDEVSTPVNELVNDSISFKGFNGIYFRNG